MNKLTRSRTDKFIAGVCGGIGEYFKIDANLVRVAFVLLALFGQVGVLLYGLLWLVLPAGEDGPTGLDQLKNQFGRN